MIILNSLKELINQLKNDETIKRYKQLESIIDNDEKLNADYKILKDIQKQMVNAEHKKSANLSDIKSKYDTHLAGLNNHILMSEYLELTEAVNSDLQLIKSIINDELNMDND